MTDRIAHLEALFASLLNDAECELSDGEREEVQHFIDHDEYGIALEAIVDVYKDKGNVPREKIASLIAALAEAMGMHLQLLWKRAP